METDSSIWHKSGEMPKDESAIIIIHDEFGKDKASSVFFYKDYQERFSGKIYHHYNIFMRYGRSYEYWDRWLGKIKKWCYVDDLLKIQ